MSALSVAIVCRNNESTLATVLESVAPLAPEIVAVDSGSTDNTIVMLERAGARVIRTEWKGHVATKQMALEACAREWVLCLDSDEPVEPDLRDGIRALVDANDTSVAGARVNRRVWYLGRPLLHAWQPEWRLRLVRRGKGRWTGLDPHDRLEIVGDGRIVDLPGVLRHDSFRTMEDHLAKQIGHARVSARSLRDAGVRASVARLVVSPPAAFFKQLLIKGAWRDGWRGWNAAASTACATMMKHMLLLEKEAMEERRER